MIGHLGFTSNGTENDKAAIIRNAAVFSMQTYEYL